MMFKNSKNQLLVRDDVGKARPSVRDLPTFGHSYGHKPAPDKEGVSACKLRKVNDWHYSIDELDIPLANGEERGGQGLQRAKSNGYPQ